MSEIRRLHIGCFDQVFPGWINTDITPHIFVARIPGLALLLFRVGVLSRQRYEQHRQGIFRAVRYLNAAKKFPYSDNTFDYVYSAHCLEHLYPHQAKFCISEIYRVLNKGGIVRIAVPDLDKVVASYDPLCPQQFLESIFEVQQKGHKDRHYWHYNQISLSQLLSAAGFQDVRRCEFQQGRCADVSLIDNRPESLFMEAMK
jgi:ubiquinone/menaquinone biosynthesis C-methylase UbiE